MKEIDFTISKQDKSLNIYLSLLNIKAGHHISKVWYFYTLVSWTIRSNQCQYTVVENPELKKVKKKTRIYPGLKSFLFWFLIFCHFFSVLISDLVNQHGDFPSYGNFSNFFWWVFGVGFLVPTKIVYVLVSGYLGGRGGGRDLHRLKPQVQTHGFWPTELTGKSQAFYHAA